MRCSKASTVGIGIAAVAVARLLVQEAPFGALRALVDEALGQEERFGRLAEGRALVALMDEAGFDVVFVFLRQGHEPILKLFFKKNNRLLFAEKLLGSVLSALHRATSFRVSSIRRFTQGSRDWRQGGSVTPCTSFSFVQSSLELAGRFAGVG